jgi:hypothetical protein
MFANEMFMKMRVDKVRQEVRLEAREEVSNDFFRVCCEPIQRWLDIKLGSRHFG